MEIKISGNLRALRIRERYSMEDVAEIIGVSRQAVAKWETGESLPDIEKCVKLSKLYKVTLDALVSKSIENMIAEGNADEGKHCFGIVRVGDNGEITLPQKTMEVFGIKKGENVLILGDEKRGIAIVKCEGFI